MAPSRIVLSPRWPLGRRLAMLLEGARCGKKESLRCVLGLRSVRHGQGAAGHRARRVHMLRCARRLACGWWRAHNARVFFQLRLHAVVGCEESSAAASGRLVAPASGEPIGQRRQRLKDPAVFQVRDGWALLQLTIYDVRTEVGRCNCISATCKLGR